MYPKSTPESGFFLLAKRVSSNFFFLMGRKAKSDVHSVEDPVGLAEHPPARVRQRHQRPAENRAAAVLHDLNDHVNLRASRSTDPTD